MNSPTQDTLDVLYEVVESDPYHRQFRPLVQEIAALQALLRTESARLDWCLARLVNVPTDNIAHFTTFARTYSDEQRLPQPR